MSLRVCGTWLSVVPGAIFLLVAPVVADDEPPSRDTEDGGRVPASVVSPAARPAVGQPSRQECATQPEPRVLVRDLRAREGYDALYDEYENFDRFFRFQRRIAERGLRSGRGYRCPPFRSYVDEYIALSEYERYRKSRDRHRREMEVRKARLLSKHEQVLGSGLRLMKEGQYERAVVALTMAAELNHGDPACRIHLAQTRLARGQYLEAGLALRRGLQLQPKLAYADLHLEDCYQQADEFDRYTDALDKWLQENAAHAEVHFLLGYLEFQRGNFDAAHVAFERVNKSLPDDDLTRDYLKITKPAGPSADRSPLQEQQQQQPAEQP